MILSDKSKFTPAPEGMHNAICTDIVDIGEVDTQWGKKHKIRISWELPETKMEDGRPFIISNLYVPSLNEKSNLRKHLKSWRGRDFTVDELKGFDLEQIIGKCCQILIQHSVDGDTTYANIAAIMKAVKVVAANPAYVRAKDRPENKKPAPASTVPPPEDLSKLPDCPF